MLPRTPLTLLAAFFTPLTAFFAPLAITFPTFLAPPAIAFASASSADLQPEHLVGYSEIELHVTLGFISRNYLQQFLRHPQL